MAKNNNLAATGADIQAILTNELGNLIKKSVLFYIDERDSNGMVSSFEREMIAEDAWEKVVEKHSEYKATGHAKFRTWAKTVARNQASDDLDKLQRDALHLTSSLYGEQPKENFDDNTDEAKPVCYKPLGCTTDCNSRLYWKDALETLKDIVSNYDGRDRTVAQMLIACKTKEEIMAETQMTGGNVDTCKSRVRKKMRDDLLKAGYSLTA